MKLNQLLPILKSVQKNSEKIKEAVYHKVQKATLFAGVSKTYEPEEEDGLVYPSETNAVTYKVADMIEEFIASLSEYYDLASAQDYTNTFASADVVVDGVTLLSKVPVSYLLFLEKQLIDIRTFVGKLPRIPIDKQWEYDIKQGYYCTPPRKTLKYKKTTTFVIAAPATVEHQAQVREVSKDIVEGYWTTIEYSSGITDEDAKQILKRVEKLITAVIQARQEANSVDVTEKKCSDKIFGYLFPK
jgi:hypothetical protein